MESESIYLFEWNLIMAWNQNLFNFFALESESISHFTLESESNYSLGEIVLSPDLKSSCVSFIYQLEDEPHIENNQIYLHPLQPHSPANNFLRAQQIFNG